MGRHLKLAPLLLLALMLAIVWGDYAYARGVKVRLGSAIGRGLSHAGPRVYGNDVLTTDQLVACMRLETDVNASADKIDDAANALTDEKQSLEEFTTRITREQASLNRYSQAAIDSYNSLIDEHRARTAAFNSKLPNYNAVIDAHNASVRSFNSSCTDKKYYESDMESARKIVAESASEK